MRTTRRKSVASTGVPLTGEPGAPAGLLGAVLDALPDGVVLCDGRLAPVLAGAPAAWLLAPDGGWAGTPAAAQARSAVAAALDRGGVAAVRFEAQGRRWEARAAPLDRPPLAAAVLVGAVDDLDAGRRDAVLRAAHDLKAPLHAIEGFASVLRASRHDSETAHGMLDVVREEGRRLRMLLERLLDEVRTGLPVSPAGPDTVEARADLVRVAETVIVRLRGAAAARGVSLQLQGADGTAEAPPAATGVTAAIAEEAAVTVLENLITNALDAAAPSGEVVVSVERRSGDAVRCSVLDSGPGLPEAALERVFEPYFRLQQGSGVGAGSTGLGLAISRGLVEQCGGRIKAANRAGGGAVFWFEVPVAPEGKIARPVVRLAAVMTHSALAAASALLERHATGRWRVTSWESGVLTVELDGDRAAAERTAASIGGSSSFAAWVV